MPIVPAKKEKSEAQICALLVESATAPALLVDVSMMGAVMESGPAPTAELVPPAPELLRKINVPAEERTVPPL